MNLHSMKQERHEAVEEADKIVRAAEAGNRDLTSAESAAFEAHTAKVAELGLKINRVQLSNTLRVGSNGFIQAGTRTPGATLTAPMAQSRTLTSEYAAAFHTFLASGGTQTSAALYESSGSNGGYAVPITVAGQIVELAPAETGVRTLATIIPTQNDIKIPRKTTFSVALGKTETGATTNSFVESEPTLDSFTLSAYMGGIVQKLSFELLQDVAAFQSFCISDMLTAISEYEEGIYVSGSGVNTGQGLLGNVGAGISGATADANGHLVSIDALENLIGTLNAMYHPNASWLMNRTTSIGIRAAQRQANLFDPVFTRIGSQDYLFSYPVTYSSQMPAATAGSSPVLFGDFRAGFIIGERGGAGVNVKILDQPFAVQGQVALLAYRRMDCRVRRSEAIQQLTLHT